MKHHQQQQHTPERHMDRKEEKEKEGRIGFTIGKSKITFADLHTAEKCKGKIKENIRNRKYSRKIGRIEKCS